MYREIKNQGVVYSVMYREIKNQGVVYSVEIGVSRSFFVDFCRFFRDNIGRCGEGGVKEGVLGDTSPLVLKNTLKFPVFRRTSPVGPGMESSNLRIQRIPGLA